MSAQPEKDLLKTITLEDVQCAIRVLNAFLKQEHDAKRVLRQLGVREGHGGGGFFSMEYFAKMAADEIEKRKSGAGQAGAEQEPQLSEDDLKKMREIAERNKKPA